MNFNLQPTLKGKLLELRPLSTEDFDSLFNVASDPLIWEQHPANNRYEKNVFEKFFQDAIHSGGALVAIDAKNRTIIGSFRYHGYDPNKSEIEIGWTFLARPYWGGVYNKEMKRLMLEHAFKFVNSVIFVVGVKNIRSQRAVLKIGGKRVGTGKDDGGNKSFIYHILKSDYINDK
jgi:RimJ/RimL family protein N-acetyltransferase